MAAPRRRRSDDTGAAVSPRTAWITLAALLAIALVYAIGAVGAVAYSAVTFGGTVAASVGMRRNRPAPRWPSALIIVAGVLWTVAGALSDALGASGDLSRTRPLIPDVFALPGYVLFGVALQGLLRSRRRDGDHDGLLDGVMLAAGASLVVHLVIIEPMLDIDNTWIMARLVVAAYPTLAMCLLVIAARLAFSAGMRSRSFTLLLVGTVSLLVGDVVFALGEIGRFELPTALLEVPYLLVPPFLGVALLHPSVRDVGRVDRSSSMHLGPARLAAVSMALLAPIGIIASGKTAEGQLVSIVLCVVLSTAAVARVVSSMRAQSRASAALYHQATHDELTGLPSRSLLVELTDELLADPTQAPVALMFLDLDQFKFVNDSMGHSAGDELLVLVAERLAASTREVDLVCRISGDEFAVVAPNLDSFNARLLADRLRGTFRRPFALDEGEVFVSASIGVTVASERTDGGAAVLLQEADTAMYRSKDAGGDATTLFDETMRERVSRRVQLERQLRRSLDLGEMSIAFQPIVASPVGPIQGFEALARWELDGRMVSPAEFIPVAEESGLIIPLGAFVLDEACRHLAWWRANLPGGSDLTMSVNLSPRQMRAADVVDVVADALRRHDLPGDALWLEITESVMIDDSLVTLAVMSGLCALGVRLAVDDFGTGYSALGYLKRFPMSRVKVDRSFVAGLGKHDSDSSLVAAIVAMATALGLESVAEGVETHEQAHRLVQLGCTQMQGYLFSAPVDAGQVPELLHRLGPRENRRVVRARRCAAPTTRG
jgi:diguanylate cyclase (GGDEF)-like protein